MKKTIIFMTVVMAIAGRCGAQSLPSRPPSHAVTTVEAADLTARASASNANGVASNAVPKTTTITVNGTVGTLSSNLMFTVAGGSGGGSAAFATNSTYAVTVTGPQSNVIATALQPAALAGYLPLTGGTLSGGLTVHGSIGLGTYWFLQGLSGQIDFANINDGTQWLTPSDDSNVHIFAAQDWVTGLGYVTTTVTNNLLSATGNGSGLTGITAAQVGADAAGSAAAVASQKVGVAISYYGAVGDGVTTNNAALLAALTNANIWIPSGTYLFSTPLTITNQTIAGMGQCSKLVYTGAGAAISTVGDSTLRDFQLTGGGVSVNSIGQPVVNGLFVYNVTGNGVYVSGSNDILDRYNHVLIEGCVITNCAAGVCMNGNSFAEYSRVVNCYVSHCATGMVQGSANCLFFGNQIVDNNNGVWVAPGDGRCHSRWTGNTINHCTTYCIYIAGATTGDSFTGNNIEGNGGVVTLYIDSFSNPVFQNNFFELGQTAIYSTLCRFDNNYFWTAMPTQIGSYGITGAGNTVIGNSEGAYDVTGRLQLSNPSTVGNIAFNDLTINSPLGWYNGETHGIFMGYSSANPPATLNSLRSIWDGSYADWALANDLSNTNVLMFWKGYIGVGIKNTNPAYELDVTGTIRASTDVITTGGASLKAAMTNYVAAVNVASTAGTNLVVAATNQLANVAAEATNAMNQANVAMTNLQAAVNVASTNYQASLGYIATTQATQTATLSTLSTLAAQGTNGASTSILIPTTSGTITLYATNNAAVYNVLSGAGSITLAADSGWNTTYSGCEVVLTLYYYNTGSTAYGSNIITNGLPAVTLSTTRTNIIVLDKAPYGTGFVEFNLGTCP